MAPSFYRKLDRRLGEVARHRDLPDWRKAFKSEWERCESALITLPINDAYRPDPHKWTCACPYFVTSRFLVCKHLVHAVETVDPIFFYEVSRNRTTPFWSHPVLKVRNAEARGTTTNPEATTINRAPRKYAPNGDEDEDAEFEDTLSIFRRSKEEFCVEMASYASIFEELASVVRYNVQFNDHRALQTLKREGASLFRLAGSIFDQEHRMNSQRVKKPKTWDRGLSGAMYFRSREPQNGA